MKNLRYLVAPLVVVAMFVWYAWACYHPPGRAWTMLLYPRGTPPHTIVANRERVMGILADGVDMGGTGARPGVGLLADLFDEIVLIDARMRGKVVEYRTGDGWTEVPDGARVSMKFGNEAIVTMAYVSPRTDRTKPWLDDPEVK